MKRIVEKIDTSLQNSLPGELYVQALIRAARSVETQQDFAKKLDTSQNLLSKYENGTIKNPPSKVIGECLKIILDKHNDENISADELASHILDTLSGPDQSRVRNIIYDLISQLK